MIKEYNKILKKVKQSGLNLKYANELKMTKI